MIINNQKNISPAKRWMRMVILTALVSFCLELFSFIFSGFTTGSEIADQLPWTFYWIWLIFFFIGFSLILFRFKVSFNDFVSNMIGGILISSLFWVLVPNSFKFLTPNYYGIQSRIISRTHNEGVVNEQVVYDFPLEFGFLYRTGDSELLAQLNDSNMENDYVNARGFLFWQTGLAYGFLPNRLPEYTGKQLSLLFTVGPIFIAELFIRGIYANFLIILLVDVVLFIFRKKHIW